MSRAWAVSLLAGLLVGCTAGGGLSGTSLYRQARVLEQSSLEAARTGAVARAAGLEAQALDLYRRVDATPEMVAALNRLGSLRLTLGELSAARADFAQAYELAEVCGDRPGQAAAANNLGTSARLSGDLVLAERRFTEAIDSSEATAGTRATGLNNRALLHFAAGQNTAARRDLLDALSEDRSGRDSAGEALRLRNLATIDLQEEDWDGAIAQLAGAYRLDVDREDSAAIARDLELLAVARWSKVSRGDNGQEGEDRSERRQALSERRRSYEIDRLQGAVKDAERQRSAIETWCTQWLAVPQPVDCAFLPEAP